jgi:hypothetical protein
VALKAAPAPGFAHHATASPLRVTLQSYEPGGGARLLALLWPAAAGLPGVCAAWAAGRAVALWLPPTSLGEYAAAGHQAALQLGRCSHSGTSEVEESFLWPTTASVQN